MPALKNSNHERFVKLVASGRMTTWEAYKKAGYATANDASAKASASRLLSQPEIQNRLHDLRQLFSAEVQKRLDDAIVESNISDRVARVKALDDRWKRCQQIILERSQDPDGAKFAGGNTGLLTHAPKAVGSGENQRIVELAEVDTGLLQEMRAIEQQAAQELGQWIEKRDDRVSLSVKDLSPEALDQLLAEATRVAAAQEETVQ